MADDNRQVLRDLLISRYDILARNLARRVGSVENAHDVLQETYIKLEKVRINGPMRNPQSYLLRMVINVATDLQRAENRRLTQNEVDVLLAMPDERPSPSQFAEDRSEIEFLKRVIQELPARQRDIFVAARIKGIANSEIAHRFGVTVRTVELEIKGALEHCALKLNRARE
jgi:RNA polymerase sigma-70 factor (ECF subfamily)